MKQTAAKKHIYILSASDRFNYGDLLFPIVAKHELGKLGDYEFHNIATIKSDLTSCGAMPTESYKKLLDYQSIPKGSLLLVAGGQVLNANWSRLVSFLHPFYHWVYEKCNGERLEKLTKWLFGKNAVSFPFMPSAPAMLERMKLVYHAVGGGVPKQARQRKEVMPSLKKAHYISVRETETRRVIKNNFAVEAELVPDSVAVISDIYPKASLKKPLDQDYVCVQFGYQKSKGKLSVVLAQLRKIHRQHGLAVGLLSIGNCPGHDDDKTVEWLKTNADFPVHVLPCDTIDQITAALAHSSLFIGTSLHGVIVSMSYGNPFIGVNKQVRKVDAYSKTWAPEYLQGSVGFVKIAATATERLAAHDSYDEVIAEHKKKVRESFSKIAQIAESAQG
ncbi:polysaccharide pyruvyl transferase family protein [Lacimicrobium alkaliphilum]|uniref:Polysaccharide pyruvyl transferase domain-containing protein n=1 Tax=Lacimicrobium alkaliphilum TaxID=1526571 RepID=A0A0U3B202_9ALTE|nr:polysaccharide pyruvyl transferase family protein [Lacimicrobium alkaliphilum]ALS99272.1 hypothetical protein AT746_14080 [Lacimicrobium alkaliphilum]